MTHRFSEDRIIPLAYKDGQTRSIHIWESEYPEIIFLSIHGGMAHGGDFVTPARYFKEHGIVTVAPDLHGHDNSQKVYIPRFRVFLDDLDQVIEWTKKQYPDLPIFIMGHSVGALIGTHYGLIHSEADEWIKGYIFSSPYYVNAIKTPPYLFKVAGILSALLPKIAVPIEDITDHLTHDKSIIDRHRKDEADHIRAVKASARFANELLKAQYYIPGHIENWKHPLYCVVAGNDRLTNADATLQYLEKIDKSLVKINFVGINFHENFNELNREEIFEDILKWIKSRIAEKQAK